MAKKAELTHDNNTKSKAKYFNDIRRGICLLFKQSRTRSAALKRAAVSRTHSRCENCLQIVPKTIKAVYGPKAKKAGKSYRKPNIQADHIIPAGSFTHHDHISGYTERMLDCGVDGLQIICLECHQSKTNDENEARRKLKPTLEGS